MATATATQPEEFVGTVHELQERLDGLDDSETKQVAESLVAALVQMYGAGLEHLVSTLALTGEGGAAALAQIAEDPLLATLLLIHDLHPVPLSERVQGALEQVRPYMESHGGDVELLSLHGGVARISLRGSCSDCAASTVTLELAIKQALEDAAPDLEGLEVEGVAAQSVPAPAGPELPLGASAATLPIHHIGSQVPAGALELPMAAPGARPPVGAGAPAWLELEDVHEPDEGGLVAAEIAGARLVVANVDGTLLAYLDRCAGCGEPLHGGELTDGALRCAGCSRTFFLPRAGRSLDADGLQLDPVPLLRDGGRVKVALTA
jgi:Fe-S cluster biogenesis protein NfuA/nitrite reductase/ring-hydroxylating ferredoxin subunit